MKKNQHYSIEITALVTVNCMYIFNFLNLNNLSLSEKYLNLNHSASQIQIKSVIINIHMINFFIAISLSTHNFSTKLKKNLFKFIYSLMLICFSSNIICINRI